MHFCPAMAGSAAPSSDWEVGEYVLERVLGSGSFAKVYRARHKETGETYACKVIQLQSIDAKTRKTIESEVTVLKEIRHPNIGGLCRYLCWSASACAAQPPLHCSMFLVTLSQFG